MTIKGSNSKVFIGRYVLASKTTGFTISLSANPITYNVLQNNGTLSIPGLATQRFTLNGILDTYGADDLEVLLKDNLTTENRFTWMISDSVNVGGSMLFNSSLTIDTPVDNLITVAGDGFKTNEYFGGYYLLNEQTLSATGAQTGVTFPTSTTAGGRAILLIHSISGTATNASIKIQSDSASDFSSVADEGTFTFSAAGVQTLNLSGTVNRYIRANVVSLGGATSFNVSLLCGLSGITY